MLILSGKCDFIEYGVILPVINPLYQLIIKVNCSKSHIKKQI